MSRPGTCLSPSPPVTQPALAAGPRVTGVDLARGLALLGMIAAHVLDSDTKDRPPARYALLVAGAPAFAVVWRRHRDQGPLEALVGRASGRARRAVLGGPASPAGAAHRG